MQYFTDGSTMIEQNDDAHGSLASYIEWTCTRTATYFIHVRGFASSQSGTFTLTVTAAGGHGGHGGATAGGAPCVADGGGMAILGGDTGSLNYQPHGQCELIS